VKENAMTRTSIDIEFNGHPDATNPCGNCGEPTNRLSYIAVTFKTDSGCRSQLCEKCSRSGPYASLGHIADGLDLIFRGIVTSRLTTRDTEAREIHHWLRMLTKSINICPVVIDYRDLDKLIAETAAAMPFVGV
jgi:hypothetical protein